MHEAITIGKMNTGYVCKTFLTHEKRFSELLGQGARGSH
jgi:hypothetical protein